MKIKAQFHLLLTGIIIIPFSLFLLILSQHYINSSQSLIIPGYDELVENGNIKNSEIPLDAKSWEVVQKKLSRRPADIEYMIFDKNYSLIYTNLDFSPKENEPYIKEFSAQELFDFMHSTNQNYFYQIDSSSPDKENSLYVITRLPKKSPRHPDRLRNPLFIFALVMIALFIFCSIVIFLIIKSISKSVTLLDDYTKRIASGDLDLEVEVTGSNEIVSLTHSLNRMRLSLREEETRRNRFIMGLSHDLRTPIALIKGYAEAIFDGMVDDIQMREKSIEIIINKADQLNERIDELIDFVKINSAEWRQSLQEKELKSILDEFCKRLTMDGELLNRNVTCDIQLPNNCYVFMDEKLFVRALENITSNAFRYTNNDGNVTIKSFINEKTKTPIISIRDDGQGISKKDLPYIFDPLYRGTNSRREEGKGLGLSVVKTVVDCHGWNLHVNSQEGNGCEFIIQLGM